MSFGMFWIVGFGLVLAAVLGVPLIAERLFERRVDSEIRALLAKVPEGVGNVVLPSELTGLPEPVQRWLEVSGVVGKPRVRSVRLRQFGQMRTAVGQPWMPVEAEQYFSVDEPGFIWKVRARMLGFLPLFGRDRWVDGRGHMRIVLAGLFGVADAKGPEIDQGALLRFLGEIVWFPSAALAPYISWEPIDAARAKATLCFGGVSASAIFAFDSHGRFQSLSAKRYMFSRDGSTLERWVIPATEWRTLDGVEVPVKGEAVWQLASGELDYYRWQLSELERDRPRLFSEDARERDLGPRPRVGGAATAT